MPGVPATFSGLCRAKTCGLALHLIVESAENSFSKVYFFFDSLLKGKYDSIKPFLEDYLLSKNEAILLRCLSKNQRMKSIEKITAIPISNLYYYKYSAMRKLGLKSTKELFRYLNRVLNHSV